MNEQHQVLVIFMDDLQWIGAFHDNATDLLAAYRSRGGRLSLRPARKER